MTWMESHEIYSQVYQTYVVIKMSSSEGEEGKDME